VTQPTALSSLRAYHTFRMTTAIKTSSGSEPRPAANNNIQYCGDEFVDIGKD